MPDTTDEQQPTGKVSASDMIARYDGSTVRMAERLAALETDNYAFREKNRELKAERDSLKTRVAPDGALVLTAEAASDWQQYQALGKASDLKATLEGATAAQQKLQTLEREKAIGKFADDHSLKASVLLKLLPPDAELLSKDMTGADGTAVKQAYVKTSEGEAPLLEAYADFAASLVAGNGQQPATNGAFYPPQQGHGGQPPTKQMIADETRRLLEKSRRYGGL